MQILKVLLVWSALFGQPEPQDVPQNIPKSNSLPTLKFPVVPVPSKLQETLPTPSPDKDVPFVLLPGKFYIVQDEKPFLLRASPKDLVTVKKLSGPRDFYGQFADGDGTYQDRTYTAKYLAVVMVVEGKSGKCELVAFPEGVTEESGLMSVWIEVGHGSQPPPDSPDKTPVPVPADTTDTFKDLIQSVTSKYTNLPISDKSKVAEVFRDIAKKADAGEVKDLQQLTKNTSDKIVEKIGLNAYLPFVPWRDDITKVLKTQSFSTPKDHVKPWNTIADVLEGK